MKLAAEVIGDWIVKTGRIYANPLWTFPWELYSAEEAPTNFVGEPIVPSGIIQRCEHGGKNTTIL